LQCSGESLEFPARTGRFGRVIGTVAAYNVRFAIAGRERKNQHSGGCVARGINKVILIGNLGADPETRYMPSGGAVTNIRIATSESWKDKTSGEQQERTEWHNVAFFGRLAEIAGEYLRKGSQVYVEGRLRTRKWQDRDGNDRYTTEVIASDMQMIGGRPGAGAPARAESGASHEPVPPPPDTFDDDIPF